MMLSLRTILEILPHVLILAFVSLQKRTLFLNQGPRQTAQVDVANCITMCVAYMYSHEIAYMYSHEMRDPWLQ